MAVAQVLPMLTAASHGFDCEHDSVLLRPPGLVSPCSPLGQPADAGMNAVPILAWEPKVREGSPRCAAKVERSKDQLGSQKAQEAGSRQPADFEDRMPTMQSRNRFPCLLGRLCIGPTTTTDSPGVGAGADCDGQDASRTACLADAKAFFSETVEHALPEVSHGSSADGATTCSTASGYSSGSDSPASGPGAAPREAPSPVAVALGIGTSHPEGGLYASAKSPEHLDSLLPMKVNLPSSSRLTSDSSLFGKPLKLDLPAPQNWHCGYPAPTDYMLAAKAAAVQIAPPPGLERSTAEALYQHAATLADFGCAAEGSGVMPYHAAFAPPARSSYEQAMVAAAPVNPPLRLRLPQEAARHVTAMGGLGACGSPVEARAEVPSSWSPTAGSPFGGISPGGAGQQGRRFTCKFVFGGFDLERDADFELVPRLIGRGGQNMRDIAKACDGKVRIRGRGSGHREQQQKGRCGMEEADVPLQIALSCKDRACYEEGCKRLVALLGHINMHFERYCRRKGLTPTPELFSVVEGV
mmetsp:Transcript_589/g.2063  ORF Transcript_589/g.2063 Transcript_589/m.2063 type:complete len:525 (-) Transcript_589:31-1605(-)